MGNSKTTTTTREFDNKGRLVREIITEQERVEITPIVSPTVVQPRQPWGVPYYGTITTNSGANATLNVVKRDDDDGTAGVLAKVG